MNLKLLILFFLLGVMTAQGSSFKAGKGEFLVDDKPFLIKAAELHYPRIPQEYWDQRIKLSKALGMNTVCLYVFWNAHETEEGKFDFSGQNDLRKFVKLCEGNGMKVILRPGPYVCAEWEMGGLPWWLLKKKDIRLRENDPYFLEKVGKFLSAVAEQVGDLTVEKEGPIIMIQVENEYGAYGKDKEYVAIIRDMLRDRFGNDILMFQCDWSSNFTLNGLDDLIWTMNFGTGADIDSQFQTLREIRPETPLMCSEFWSGWFDKWGAVHETRPSDDMISGIDEMLSKGISFSLYMTHGGTNWGHWAGANSPGYSPDVTSYDYDAPISESGQPTEKFWKLRETISKYIPEGESLPELPDLIEPMTIPQFGFEQVAPLLENLPKPIFTDSIATFEDLDMGFGSVLYRTTLPFATSDDTILLIEEPHDYAQVFVNREFKGTLDRRDGKKELTVGAIPEGAQLDILVEAMGRINFGRAIKDFKGITERVALVNKTDTTEVKGWSAFLFPDELQFYESLTYQELTSDGTTNNSSLPAGIYKGYFTLPIGTVISDTFLDFSKWGKGLVYVNGHGLGRIWHIGPQQTLYLPGAWLKEGENEVIVFDCLGPKEAIVEGLDHPVLDFIPGTKNTEPSLQYNITDMSPFVEDSFETGGGWKEVTFGEELECRVLAFECLSTYQRDFPAVAEIYLLDKNGIRLSRDNWKGSASSEDKGSGNHDATKAFDLQESTYWTPEPYTEGPHVLFIDMGSSHKISGLQYLPRMETGTPGSISGFRVYGLP